MGLRSLFPPSLYPWKGTGMWGKGDVYEEVGTYHFSLQFPLPIGLIIIQQEVFVGWGLGLWTFPRFIE